MVHGELGRSISLIKEKLGKQVKILKGRQIAWIVYQHYKTSEQEGAILDINDLLNVKHDYKNLRGFINAWESTLEGMSTTPQPDMLETLFLPQLEKNTDLSGLLSL